MRNRKLHDELERLIGWMVSQGMPKEVAETMMLESLSGLRKNLIEDWDKILKQYLSANKTITKS